jgi:hypothetical protein
VLCQRLGTAPRARAGGAVHCGNPAPTMSSPRLPAPPVLKHTSCGYPPLAMTPFDMLPACQRRSRCRYGLKLSRYNKRGTEQLATHGYRTSCTRLWAAFPFPVMHSTPKRLTRKSQTLFSPEKVSLFSVPSLTSNYKAKMHAHTRSDYC